MQIVLSRYPYKHRKGMLCIPCKISSQGEVSLVGSSAPTVEYMNYYCPVYATQDTIISSALTLYKDLGLERTDFSFFLLLRKSVDDSPPSGELWVCGFSNKPAFKDNLGGFRTKLPPPVYDLYSPGFDAEPDVLKQSDLVLKVDSEIHTMVNRQNPVGRLLEDEMPSFLSPTPLLEEILSSPT